jgi:hypothetical protein
MIILSKEDVDKLMELIDEYGDESYAEGNGRPSAGESYSSFLSIETFLKSKENKE